MRTHFALVGGTDTLRRAVGQLLWKRGYLAFRVESDVDGCRLIDRDDWFRHRLPVLRGMALFDSDNVLIEDVVFNDEAHVLRAMGVRIVHCGRSPA